jgi:hypothetical protein
LGGRVVAVVGEVPSTVVTVGKVLLVRSSGAWVQAARATKASVNTSRLMMPSPK